jgi:polyisoprenoid-binding protein YceI
MSIESGTHQIGPDNGQVTVNVYKDGVAAKMGHDLVLQAKQWSGKADINSDDPSASSVQVTIDPSSLEVIGATGGAKPLSDKDKGDIGKNINDKILNTSRYQEITFESTGVTGSSMKGNLTIAGSTQPVTLDLSVNESTGEVTGKTSFQQTQFGLKPFSAMMGALKVKDKVEIEVKAKLPTS